MTALTGTVRLVRLALRTDRLVLPAWLVAIAALATTVVVSVAGLYPTAAERVAAATFMAGNPIARAFDGPAAGAELGALITVESTGVLSVLAGLLAVQTVVRHTRREEESGRAELVGSAVVGRHARLAAALVVATGAALTVGAIVAVVLLAQGLAVAGSVLAGLAVASVGVVFAGVAAVTAQLVCTARGANGLAGALLGAAFLLRAIGDAAGEVAASGVEVVSAWPSWLSPIGWAQQARPFGGDRFEVLLLALVTTVALLAVAALLAVRRDHGAGMIAPRTGPASASRWLRTPSGLVWRLHRGALVAWTASVAALGAVFGAVGDNVEELLEVSPEFADVLGAVAGGSDLVDLYLALAAGILAVIASGALVQLLLRARTEEVIGRLEPILATAVSRRRWMAVHLAMAAVAGVVVVVALGSAGAGAFAVMTGDARGGAGMLTGAVAHLPAVWVLGAVVALAVALAPRWAPAIGWSAFGGAFVVGQFGALFGLPEAVQAVSPFHHVGAVPAEDVAVAPLVVLTGLAALLAVAATEAFARRDLALTA